MNEEPSQHIRRRDDGSIDVAHYVDRAGALRWAAMRDLATRLVRGVHGDRRWRAVRAIAAGPVPPRR